MDKYVVIDCHALIAIPLVSLHMLGDMKAVELVILDESEILPAETASSEERAKAAQKLRELADKLDPRAPPAMPAVSPDDLAL